MKLSIVSQRDVADALARRWVLAGHTVTRCDPGGGDAVDADAVVIAVPAGKIAAALGSVTGLRGTPPSPEPGESPNGRSAMPGAIRCSSED